MLLLKLNRKYLNILFRGTPLCHMSSNMLSCTGSSSYYNSNSNSN